MVVLMSTKIKSCCKEVWGRVIYMSKRGVGTFGKKYCRPIFVVVKVLHSKNKNNCQQNPK